MATLEELKEENSKLKAEAEVKSDMAKHESEKVRLEAENRSLRHPKLHAFVASVSQKGSAGEVDPGIPPFVVHLETFCSVPHHRQLPMHGY